MEYVEPTFNPPPAPQISLNSSPYQMEYVEPTVNLPPGSPDLIFVKSVPPPKPDLFPPTSSTSCNVSVSSLSSSEIIELSPNHSPISHYSPHSDYDAPVCHSLDPILEDAPSPTSYYSPFPDHISHPPLEDSSSPMSRCPSLSDHNHDPTINSLSPNSYRPPHSDYDPLDHSPSSYSPLSTFSFLSNVLSPFTDSDEGKSLRFFSLHYLLSVFWLQKSNTHLGLFIPHFLPVLPMTFQLPILPMFMVLFLY